MKIVPPKALAGPPNSAAFAMGRSSTESVIFFLQGRDAIHYVCRAIGIGPGDCVLAPALICRSAVEPILATGSRVEFVDIAADLDYNQDLLDAAFIQHRPKALLAVHHFGRRPHLERYRDLCTQFGTVLIEDRCHSLPSTMDLSSNLVGDYAIYSLRKFLPVPDGGMLVCRESGLSSPSAYGSLSLSGYGKFILQRLGKRLFYSGVCNPYAFRRWRKKSGGQSGKGAHFTYGPPQHGASRFLAKWLDGGNISTVIDKHRRNYRQIAALLPADIVCRLSGDFFDAQSTPVAFPIVDSSQQIDLVERLRALGIGAYTWPGRELPMEVRGRYPEAERLARRLAMLPIHYDLTDVDLSYVASVVKKEIKQGRAC